MGLKIGIIGHGFVGSAVAYANKHNNVIINDPAIPDSRPLEEFKDCDAVFVCVPSPSKDNGECDTSILNSVLFLLRDYKNVIISKTTAPPPRRLDWPNRPRTPETTQPETQRSQPAVSG